MRLKADCAQPLAQRCCAHQPRRRPTWTTRHPARFEKHADYRPLLQQSLSNCGRVVQSGKRAAFPSAAHLVRLTDRHSGRTATGALRRTIRPTPVMHGPRCQRQQLLSTAIGMFIVSALEVFLMGFFCMSRLRAKGRSVVAAGIFARVIDTADADTRSRLAVEAQNVAARDQKAPLLGQQRHLISGEGISHHLPEGWISLHLGQEPQQLTLGHGSYARSAT